MNTSRLIGERFGALTVVGFCESKNGTYWNCVCDCGSRTVVRGSRLTGGITKSCGCVTKLKTHGLRGDSVYGSWRGMLRRCYEKNYHAYSRYGGDGIFVCEFLRASPANLITLLGERPSGNHSIDRIDTNGSYTCGICAECLLKGWPSNVRWATPLIQNRNRNCVTPITYHGQTQYLSDWSKITGIPYRTLITRRGRGDTGEDLFRKRHSHVKE